MRYREHPPPPELAPFVTCFWETARAADESHRVLPDGAMDVIFAMGDDVARVVGPMTRAIVVEGGAASSAIGVRLRPGAAIELLGVRPRDLLDEAVPARDTWGPHGRALDAHLAESLAPRDAIARVAAFLVERAKNARAPDARLARAVRLLGASGGALPVGALAASVGIGDRQLGRLFDEQVGYGPKTFARVARLQRATSSIARGPSTSWARLAVDCGFADQAHMIREFRALTGVTPTTYASSRAMSEIDNPAHRVATTFGA